MNRGTPLIALLAANVKAVKKARGLTQKAIAAKAKRAGYTLDQGTVSRVERQEYPPTLETLEAIAFGMKVQAWQLLVPDIKGDALPALSSGQTPLSKEQAKQVDGLAKQLADLTPAQRDMFVNRDDVRKLIDGPAYPEERMNPVEWVEPRGNE